MGDHDRARLHALVGASGQSQLARDRLQGDLGTVGDSQRRQIGGSQPGFGAGATVAVPAVEPAVVTDAAPPTEEHEGLLRRGPATKAIALGVQGVVPEPDPVARGHRATAEVGLGLRPGQRDAVAAPGRIPIEDSPGEVGEPGHQPVDPGLGAEETRGQAVAEERAAEGDAQRGHDLVVRAGLAEPWQELGAGLEQVDRLERHPGEGQVRPFQPADRRQEHIGVFAGAVLEHVDGDDGVERAEGLAEPMGAGNRTQRVPGDADQRAHPLGTLGQDLVGEDAAGETIEHRRKAPDAARRLRDEETGRAGQPGEADPDRREEGAASAVVVSGDEGEGLERDVAQRPEGTLVDADG